MDRINLILYLSALNIGYKSQFFIINNYDDITEFKKDLKNSKLDSILPSRTLDKLNKNKDNISLNSYKEELYKNNCDYITILDEKFPENLKNISDPPLILYYKGNFDKLYEYGISVVGARKCTNYGAWACEHLVSELSRLQIPTISGLAAGIDSIVHNTSINKKGITLGVLGNGIDTIYPKSNRYLYEKMIDSKLGCIITEYPLGVKPMGYNFPRRNRIISGLGLGTLVIEAKEKSGTLITAGYAGDQGKEIFAVPGNINSIYSKGTHDLINDGAKLVSSVYDILEELPVLKDLIQIKDESRYLNLTEKELELYKLIEKDFLNIDEISRKLNIKINELNVLLTTLELKDYIKEMQGGKYSVI